MSPIRGYTPINFQYGPGVFVVGSSFIRRPTLPLLEIAQTVGALAAGSYSKGIWVVQGSSLFTVR